MGKTITPTSNEGQAIQKIIAYLFSTGMTAQAENIHNYLYAGNFEISGWFIRNFIGSKGMTPFPDTGSGTTIYIDPSRLPLRRHSWDMTDPSNSHFYKSLRLLELLLHEKYHAEQQDWGDRFEFLLYGIGSFLLFWEKNYNPIETDAYTYTISMLDKMIDNRLLYANSLLLNSQYIGQFDTIIKRIVYEVKEMISRKIQHADIHNRRYRPDIPKDKLFAARYKIEYLENALNPNLLTQFFILHANDILSTLDQFEDEMNNM